MSPSAEPQPRGVGRPGTPGVIHDLGYRPYAGPRQAEGQIALALFVTGLRNAFGLGRSGKSKLLPFILLGLNLLPALIIVAIMVFTRLDELPISYAAYAGQTQMLLSVFAAAQAPILFSRDLRHGSIVLYLARPLRSATYALMRWCSLTAALLIFLVTPILVLLLGAVLSEADLTDQLTESGLAVLVALLLAGMLASVTGVISAWSTRRGFGVVASIAVLLFGYGAVAAVQAIAYDEGADRIGEYAGLLAPYALYRGICASVLDSSVDAITAPQGALMETAYVGVAVLILLGGLALLMWRYRKAAAR
jgi:ABC-2 type transport system permease protein